MGADDERRRAIYAAYEEGLAAIAGIGFQPVAPWTELVPWLFSITVEARQYGRSRDELAALLAERASIRGHFSILSTGCRRFGKPRRPGAKSWR